MYQAKHYRDFNKVWKKYGGRWLRKYGKKQPCKVSFIVDIEEHPELWSEVKKSRAFGGFSKVFEEKILGKKVLFDENQSATFVGVNFTNIGLFYILKTDDGQKGQVHSSYFAFTNL